MVFNSIQYAIFLPLVLLAYQPLHRRGQNALLLTASWVFYGLWGWRFLGLMLLTTVTDYTVGRVLEVTEGSRRRRQVFALSLFINLAVLGFFKYFDFFSSSTVRVLNQLGLHGSIPTLHLLLPIGISFYTFHGMSYTFDVYRRRIPPCRSFLDFATFVAFFPQLVAGPIGRANIQLPQFQQDRPPLDWARTRSGVQLILVGLIKKVAIADTLAPYVNRSFSGAAHASWVSLLVGAWAFAFQIYGDFAGYSDIARGSARLFGIELPLNFAQPYFSASITEFWRRWHISLSSWLRDYLYVPLGGSRGSSRATYRNLMITMLLGGLWHGAKWTFVIWGALNGVYLVAERIRGVEARERTWSTTRRLVHRIFTFQLVCVAWVFFRSPTAVAALKYLARIATLQHGTTDMGAVQALIFAVAIALGLDLLERRAGTDTPLLTLPASVRGVVYGAGVVGLIVCSSGTPVPFIYFRF